MKWPWSRDEECTHLVKYQGTNIEIAGISVPNIFNLGSVSVKPQVLQAVDNAMKYLDMSYYNTCKAYKQAPNEEKKNEAYELMMKQLQKLNDISMAIAAFSSKQDSQKLEESLIKTIEKNLNVSLSNTIETKEELKMDDERSDIKANEKEVDPVVLYDLLLDKFSLDELKTLCFKFNINYDDIAGDNRQAKVRSLVEKLKYYDKLTEFQQFVLKYLSERKL